jgi:hypothetical protein
MNVRRYALALSVDASGDATVKTTENISGEILALRYVPDGSNPLDAGADLTITGDETGIPIVTKSNIGTSAFSLAPRQPTHAVADGAAALYAAGGTAVNAPVYIANEKIKCVVAQGGVSKTGTLYILVG